MNDFDIRRVAISWIAYVLSDFSKDGELLSGIEPDDSLKIYEYVYDNPQYCWMFVNDIMKIVSESKYPPQSVDRILGMLGAGPMEDLLSYHGLFALKMLNQTHWSDNLSVVLSSVDVDQMDAEVRNSLEDFLARHSR